MSEFFFFRVVWYWENRTFKNTPYIFGDDWEGDGQRGPHYNNDLKSTLDLLVEPIKNKNVGTPKVHQNKKKVISDS